MANNPFSDFSALKSLKKELEKQDDPKNPVKPANEPRRKTVTHKSKDEILGVPKGKELPYQLEHFKSVMRSQLKHRGSRVIFVHGVGDGVLKQVIRTELDTTYALSCTWNPYGDGATAVTIK